MNLLENAWVHSGSDAPIELDIKEEGNKVVFYIRDHGNGIAPERLDQLFDGCAGALDHESRKGMGIGLSICKSIVMAHQGDVYARNYEDGAEFSFSLPMDGKRIDGGKGTMTEIKFNVLIAEDEENIGKFYINDLKNQWLQTNHSDHRKSGDPVCGIILSGCDLIRSWTAGYGWNRCDL